MKRPLTDAELAEINKGWREFGKKSPAAAIEQAAMAEELAHYHQHQATEHHEFSRSERARAKALREGAAEARSQAYLAGRSYE